MQTLLLCDPRANKFVAILISPSLFSTNQSAVFVPQLHCMKCGRIDLMATRLRVVRRLNSACCPAAPFPHFRSFGSLSVRLVYSRLRDRGCYFVPIFVMDQASSGGFARICVFCGSSSGKKPIYTEVARQLGSEMVTRGIDLVYGGGSIGLMGTLAKAVQDAGGRVVGVIPKALMPKEICGATVGDLVTVDDMHQRKAEMARRADAFIALPGGFGTFEEVLEMITWAQLGIHKKPVGLLNVDGYYDAMLALFDKALDQGFLNMASRNIVVHAPTVTALLDNLKNYAPTVDKSVPELTW